MEELSPDEASFHGRWWVPDDPEHVVGGQLGLDGEFWP
jgi:hypothetical protein